MSQSKIDKFATLLRSCCDLRSTDRYVAFTSFKIFVDGSKISLHERDQIEIIGDILKLTFFSKAEEPDTSGSFFRGLLKAMAAGITAPVSEYHIDDVDKFKNKLLGEVIF